MQQDLLMIIMLLSGKLLVFSGGNQDIPRFNFMAFEGGIGPISLFEPPPKIAPKEQPSGWGGISASS
jgi:hypothetical protein